MKTKKLSFCAVMAALATVIMLVAYFPYVTYAIPCMASLAVMAVVIEIDKKAALLTYLASTLPIFLFCELEAKLLYIVFMGFYPILKAVFEKLPNRIIEYLLKLVVFNLAVAAIYFMSVKLFGIGFEDMGELGKYGGIILLVAANVVFVLYDYCISKMAIFYMLRFHKTVSKMLK